MIYFDHNATTPLDEAVREAMLPFLTQFYGNPSSLYRLGRLARTAVETAREQVAEWLAVSPSQVIFTSGGTESNNLAVAQARPTQVCAVSALEHPSVLMPARYRFPALTTLAVDSHGVLKSTGLNDLTAHDFVSVMLANNETGVIQPIASIFDRLRERGVVCHTDAVQAVGKIAVKFEALHAQLMSVSSHKIYGPKGCGALVVERDFALTALLQGGGQEGGYRAGTENVAAIVGFGKAAEIARQQLTQRQEKNLQLRKALESGLKALPGCVIFSEQVPRLPNTVQFSLAGVDGEMLQMQLDRYNIAVSSGSACSSGGGEPSKVLTAMGVEPELAKGAIRVSFGEQNEPHEIDEFISTLKKITGL